MRILAPLFFIAFISRAEIEAVPSLLDLVKSADIIAVGTLIESQENTTGATLTLQPLYFLKGTSSDTTLKFQSPGTRRSLVVNMPRAIGGLSAFANHVLPGQFTPAPGPWPHRTDQTIAYSFMGPEIRDREERYLAFWRQWWDRNQSAIRAEAAAIATK